MSSGKTAPVSGAALVDLLLALESQTSRIELEAQRSLVDLLSEAWSKMSVDRESTVHDSSHQLLTFDTERRMNPKRV